MSSSLLSRPTSFYDAYIFDLDGTVYLGDALLPNAHRAITTIRAQGKRTVFLSNNPTHTRQEYAARLSKLGLPTHLNDVLNSSMVMVDFLKRQYADRDASLSSASSRCTTICASGL